MWTKLRRSWRDGEPNCCSLRYSGNLNRDSQTRRSSSSRCPDGAAAPNAYQSISRCPSGRFSRQRRRRTVVDSSEIDCTHSLHPTPDSYRTINRFDSTTPYRSSFRIVRHRRIDRWRFDRDRLGTNSSWKSVGRCRDRNTASYPLDDHSRIGEASCRGRRTECAFETNCDSDRSSLGIASSPCGSWIIG